MTQTIQTTGAQPPLPQMTYEEFLQWADENTHAEWVDGEVILMSPISAEHQGAGAFLIALMRIFAENQGLGRVLYEPFQMKLGPDLPGRSPDIMFISNSNLPRLKKAFLDGPADLVVEIVSPESGGRDRGDKYYEYEQGGVGEYWLIDPIRKQAEFYQRGNDGYYARVDVGDDGVFHSVVLQGLWLKTDWLWQDPQPHILQIVKEWGLI